MQAKLKDGQKGKIDEQRTGWSQIARPSGGNDSKTSTEKQAIIFVLTFCVESCTMNAMNGHSKITMSSADANHDLGFGSVVASESRQRLLNRNGSFNVAREGLDFWPSLNLYQTLILTSWPRFFASVTLSYLLLNSFFAIAYFFCGPNALNGGGTELGILRTFFFSIQTFATIGYGHISPFGLVTNIIVTFESLFGLLWLALATGLVFARFSRPTAKIAFSNVAIIAPYRGITAFEFRIANERQNQIIELEAQVLFSRFVESDGKRVRHFDLLNLERNKVSFFPLSLTVVHPIDETSPLYNLTEKDFRETEAEFLILLTGIDETFSQTVHARSSYNFDEIVWNARFGAVFNQAAVNGRLTIDMRRLHDIESVALRSPK